MRGEKEIQWFTVKYAEYDTLIHPMVQKFVGHYTSQGIDGYMLLKWQNELTAHIVPFATLKIKDPELRKYRFNMFINYSLSALINRDFVINTMCLRKYKYQLNEQEIKKEEIRKLEAVFIYYQKLKAYVEKNEQEGLNYLHNETKNEYIEDVLQFKATQIYLDYLMKNRKFSCDNPYIKINGESFNRLYDLSKKSAYYNRRLHDLRILGFIYGGPRYMLFKCESKPELKEYKGYIEDTFYSNERDKKILEQHKEQIRTGKYWGD